MKKDIILSFISGAIVFLGAIIAIPFSSFATPSTAGVRVFAERPHEFSGFSCPTLYEPVCAKKNKTLKTYGNYCEMRMERAVFISSGECFTLTPFCSNGSTYESCRTPMPTYPITPSPMVTITPTNPLHVCMADVKLCSDGVTWVSRNSALGCAFNACPVTTPTPTPTPTPTAQSCPAIIPDNKCVYLSFTRNQQGCLQVAEKYCFAQ